MTGQPTFFHMLQISFAAVQIFVGLSSSAAAAQLVYEHTFDTAIYGSSISETKKEPGGCKPYNFTLGNPLGGADTALRVEARGGAKDACPENSSTSGAADRHRALLGTERFFEDQVEYWMGYRFWIEPSWPTNSGKQIHVMGINAREPAAESAFLMKDRTLRMMMHWRDKNNDKHYKESRVTLAPSRWYDIVINMKRGETNGFLKVWINREFVCNLTGQNGSPKFDPADRSPRMRIGLYNKTTSDSLKWIAYWDNWRIARGSNGYNLVNPNSAADRALDVGKSPSLPGPPTPSGLQFTVSP